MYFSFSWLTNAMFLGILGHIIVIFLVELAASFCLIVFLLIVHFPCSTQLWRQWRTKYKVNESTSILLIIFWCSEVFCYVHSCTLFSSFLFGKMNYKQKSIHKMNYCNTDIHFFQSMILMSSWRSSPRLYTFINI